MAMSCEDQYVHVLVCDGRNYKEFVTSARSVRNFKYLETDRFRMRGKRYFEGIILNKCKTEEEGHKLIAKKNKKLPLHRFYRFPFLVPPMVDCYRLGNIGRIHTTKRSRSPDFKTSTPMNKNIPLIKPVVPLGGRGRKMDEKLINGKSMNEEIIVGDERNKKITAGDRRNDRITADDKKNEKTTAGNDKTEKITAGDETNKEPQESRKRKVENDVTRKLVYPMNPVPDHILNNPRYPRFRENIRRLLDAKNKKILMNTTISTVEENIQADLTDGNDKKSQTRPHRTIQSEYINSIRYTDMRSRRQIPMRCASRNESLTSHLSGVQSTSGIRKQSEKLLLPNYRRKYQELLAKYRNADGYYKNLREKCAVLEDFFENLQNTPMHIFPLRDNILFPTPTDNNDKLSRQGKRVNPFLAESDESSTDDDINAVDHLNILR